MKKNRNILCLLLAVLLATSLATGAWAEEDEELPPEVAATPEPTPTPEVTATPEPTTVPEVTETPEPTATPESSDTPTSGTANVPTPSYTLTIPAEQSVPFGAERFSLACPVISDMAGFGPESEISLSITCTPFACEDAATTIPFTLKAADESGTSYDLGAGSLCFRGLDGDWAALYLLPAESESIALSGFLLCFDTGDWARALGGEYSAAITFTSAIIGA